MLLRRGDEKRGLGFPMRMQSMKLVSVFVFGLLAVACDGGKGNPGITVGGACPAFTPCGGNIVGTWHLKTECGPPSTTSNACSGQATTLSPGADYNATYNFAANGTLTISFSGTMSATIRYSADCLHSDAGLATACADLQKSMQSAIQVTGDAGADSLIRNLSFTCATDSAAECLCQESLTYSAVSMTGTYTTSGTQITATLTSSSFLPDGGSPDAGSGNLIDYCVSGNTLTIGPGAGSTSGSVAVLTK